MENKNTKTLLNAAGKLFNDDIISFEEWISLKKKIRDGQLLMIKKSKRFNPTIKKQ